MTKNLTTIAADQTATNSQSSLDPTNPLYMHPTESARSTLLPVKFDGTGYQSWRKGVLRELSVKNKAGFINEKSKKPEPDSETFAQWEKCDDMVTSWMLNSLSPELMDKLQYMNNAKELWEELEDRYDQTTGAKLYQLQKEINEFNQGTLDITGYGYYTKVRKH
ncbi:uncharacterized protein LOC132038421 [Lycium ferocissimum]|uniref:uncharacterized protein LOC132038421 n=1 Tax=Lycium ferocissimum TaxID=112874 RepID=UPI002816315E|nr:uncharacterized protein LOC132038421 [Lycium ferocissimum]